MSPEPYEEDTEFNLRMQPWADGIYKSLWGDSAEIQRELGELDRQRAIDTIVIPPEGLPISLQEKARRRKYFKYYQFTVEYMNNPRRGEKGEFFKLAANYYFYGYARIDEQGFLWWRVVDLNPFKRYYHEAKIQPDEVKQNKNRSNASFLCFDWANLSRVIAYEPPEIVRPLKDMLTKKEFNARFLLATQSYMPKVARNLVRECREDAEMFGWEYTQNKWAKFVGGDR